jgi:hypothetical protein
VTGGTIRALTLEDANCRFSSSSAADFASIPASLKPDSVAVLHHMTDPMINRALRGYQTYLCFQALIQNTERLQSSGYGLLHIAAQIILS